MTRDYAVYFPSDCEMYTIDFLGDEVLILFESISPYDSFFDKDEMTLVYKSEGEGGIFVSEAPDKTEREIDEYQYVANHDLLKLSDSEFDSVGIYFTRVLEFFHDTCQDQPN